MLLNIVMAFLFLTGIFAQETPDCTEIEPLTLDLIFDRAEGDIERPEIDPDCQTVIHATGDVLLARVPNKTMINLDNLNWPFEKVVEVLSAADIVIVNLENPLIANCPIRTTETRFCGRLENVESLLFASVDVVNVANNHIGNEGPAGVASTVKTLSEAGIAVTGTDRNNFAVKEVNGIQFVFLGYNEVDRQPGAAYPDRDRLESEISEARQTVGENGVIIVSLHGGVEYTHEVSDNQRDVAHTAIDAGADLVIGHHPHWYQGIEMYNGKLIMYSLGNFVFDQMQSYKTRVGYMARLVFNGSQLADVEFLPVLIHDFGQPDWLTGVDAEIEYKNLRRISRELEIEAP